MSWHIPTGPNGYLTAKDRAALTVLFDAIFPGNPDRGVPTIESVNAVGFLDRLLSCDATIYWEIPTWRDMYRDGLASLSTFAQKSYGKELSALDRNEATALLQSLEKGTLGIGTGERTMFRTLRSHCLQGCFSDPAWGGNEGELMWRWIGYRTDPQDIPSK